MAMIRKKQKDAPRKTPATAVTPADLARVTGGDLGSARMKETVVAD